MTDPKPLRLVAAYDVTIADRGVATVGRRFLGHVRQDRAMWLAEPTNSSGNRGLLSTETDARRYLATQANARTLRSALTAAGFKSPTGVYAGTEVAVPPSDGHRVVISYRCRGFGSVMSNTTRQNTLAEIADLLAARGVTVVRRQASDRYGEYNTVEVETR